MANKRKRASFDGAVDVLFRNRVQGWAWNAAESKMRPTLLIRKGRSVLAEVEASNHRRDLAAAGIGDGYYGFDVEIEPVADPSSITVEVKGARYELPIQSDAYNPLWLNPDDLPDTQITIHNLEILRSQPPTRHFYIRLDTNFDCNLHCVYCHNPRSKDLMDMGALKKYLLQRVIGVENFQFGCTMEPTLDERLTDFMLMVADTPAKPRSIFQLQTNGTLLHRHDFKKMAASGLTSLSVSLDSAEPATQKLLRSGTSLNKVLRNVSEFRSACPEISVQFITTVTSANIDRLCDVVRLGRELGVSNFAFREVFYNSKNTIVDHARMPGLVLKQGEFVAAKEKVRAEFPEVDMEFFDTDTLEMAELKIQSDSLLRPKARGKTLNFSS